MRNDTHINVAGFIITLSGEERTFATVIIGGREYSGEIGNPFKGGDPDTWIERSLMVGLWKLCDADFHEVIHAIESAMC